MGRFLSHVLRGLVVVLGLGASTSSANVRNFDDDGEALSACLSDLSSAVGLVATRAGELHDTVANISCAPYFNSTPNRQSPNNFRCQVSWVVRRTGTVHATDRCNPANLATATGGLLSEYRFTNSCSSRPDQTLVWTGGPDGIACHRGCEVSTVGAFGVSVCAWEGGPGQRVYRCAGPMRATGRTCAPAPSVGAGPRPPDPDRDGDGTPNPNDEAPDDPGCVVNCGPQPPPPDGPEPPGPEDGQDDGQQVAGELGPKLDAIEQAVLGLGPRIDGVRAAVDGARADANADADGIRSALDGIRAAIAAQGPNVPGGGEDPGDGGGDDPIDMSPLTPGDDGGEHPELQSIVEEGDADQLLGQLDQDGWGFARSCPAMTWPLSFELGWASFNMQQSIGIVCTALAILGWIIGLAGLIQASFILGRIGVPG